MMINLLSRHLAAVKGADMQIAGIIPNAKLPSIPTNLSKRIEQRSVCELSEREIEAFTAAYKMFSNYTAVNPLSFGVHCIVIFCDNKPIQIIPRSDSFGLTIPVVLVRLDLLRNNARDDLPLQCMLALLEELCHSLYHIGNEILVKQVIWQILHPYLPAAKLCQLWPKVFDENNQPIRDCYPEDYDNLTL